MTPQAFSYPCLGPDNKIYVPPYGLNKVIDFMIVLDPITLDIRKIPIQVNDEFEKWQVGIPYKNKIYFLPYNEDNILVVNTDTQEIKYIKDKKGKGKYIQGHLYKDQIIALPYGENEQYDYVLHLNLNSETVEHKHLIIPYNDEKKWHTTQILDGKIHGLPRGEGWSNGYFPFAIKYDCETRDCTLTNLSKHWKDYDQLELCNKKFTTLAKANNKIYGPPYSENPAFDILMIYKNNEWQSIRTGLQNTSRKYYSHTVATNGKIYCPPAGHDETWSEMLVIDSQTDEWKVLDLQIGKESKKYFAGIENSKGKIFYIPRGGCVCEPEDTWKEQGDLTEILVIDTKTETHYTIDVSKYFYDNTTIEKYNRCLIYNDIIFAFPYGESNSFQTVLIFDSIKEEVIGAIDLNDI